MNIARAYNTTNSWLQGFPSYILSEILIGFALFVIYVALRGSPAFKIMVLLWFLLP